MDQPKYTSVDELQERTSLEEAAAKCGVTLSVQGSGRQVRIDCPFGCSGDHEGQRELSVDVGNPQKVFQCHAYECGMRGNLLTLMHGWLTGSRPSGGTLRGEEFKRVRDVLTGRQTPPPSSAATAQRVVVPTPKVAVHNMPLAESPNEKARELETLDEKLVVDIGRMPPAAASYVRRHPCLSPASLAKWRAGVLPQDGGGDKRGWSLRGHLLYPILSEQGRLLAWVARDPLFETKEREFLALSPEHRTREKKPAKHRFPVDFHRGQELFGQHAGRLREPGYREAISRFGVIVVEGFNDVIGLDALGVPAVAVMSNRMTEEQGAKIERFARSLANGKVTLLFDADEPGEAGAKDALWQLAERGLDVRLTWSRKMHESAYANRQPEGLTAQEWNRISAFLEEK